MRWVKGGKTTSHPKWDEDLPLKLDLLRLDGDFDRDTAAID